MAASNGFQNVLKKIVNFFSVLAERIRKSDKRLLIIIAACVIVLILVLALIIHGVSSGKKKEETPSAAPVQNIVEPDTQEDPTDDVLPNGTGRYLVNSSVGLKLRPTASTDYDYLALIPDGTSLTVLFVDDSNAGESGYGWGYVEYNGQRGWVSMEFLKAA